MNIFVITPVHPPYVKYLADAYECLCRQSYERWKWIIVANQGAIVPASICKDSRVVVAQAKGSNIGNLKSFGALKCCSDADVLVEFDADDILIDDTLAEIASAFVDEQIQFVYSNSARFNEKMESPVYSERWGWRYRPFEYHSHELNESVAWPPSAHSMRRIEWAPNHVRAWRNSAYWKLGGHDVALAVGDDHDLCCRTYIKYGVEGMRHIDKCLYLYREHGDNTCKLPDVNPMIQKQTDANYCKYRTEMVKRWAKDEKLRLVDLGGRFNAWRGFETVDRCGNVDIVCDLNEEWALPDNSVGVLRASHVFEHLNDPVHAMNEAYRVLAPGGWLLLEVPSTDGRGAFQDPTHRSWWNQNSILYYTDRNWAQYIEPEYVGRFQDSRVVTYFPNEQFKRQDIPVVQADLIALKPPYDQRPVGEIKI